MNRPALRCDHAPSPSRRTLLLAAAGLAAALPSVRAAGSPLRLTDLVDADGSPSQAARSLASSRVSVRGYLAPSLDGRQFTMTEQPALPCQLCGASHDAGAGMELTTARPEPGAPMVQQVEASGRLLVDGGTVRLVDAQIEVA